MVCGWRIAARRKVRADLLANDASASPHRFPTSALLDRGRHEIVEQATDRDARQGKYATRGRGTHAELSNLGLTALIVPLGPDAQGGSGAEIARGDR